MGTNQSEMQTMFDELYEELDGVLPDEILTVAKEIQPIEVGVKVLWDLGGRIREKQPGINLIEPYAFPPEVEGLNDEINGYSFSVAFFPLDVLANAARANINADEEIIRSRDLEGFVPLIISQEGKVRKIALIDYNDHKLEISLSMGFDINIELDGDISENQEAIKDGLRQLAENLKTLKQDIAEHPGPFDSPEEEDAIKKWCNKHSYELFPVIRSSIDLYH